MLVKASLTTAGKKTVKSLHAIETFTDTHKLIAFVSFESFVVSYYFLFRGGIKSVIEPSAISAAKQIVSFKVG